MFLKNTFLSLIVDMIEDNKGLLLIFKMLLESVGNLFPFDWNKISIWEYVYVY